MSKSEIKKRGLVFKKKKKNCRQKKQRGKKKKKKKSKNGSFFCLEFSASHAPWFDRHACGWHDGSRTVRKDVQRPFRPPSLCAQSQKMIESEHFSFMPGGLFQAHLLVVAFLLFVRNKVGHVTHVRVVAANAIQLTE